MGVWGGARRSQGVLKQTSASSGMKHAGPACTYCVKRVKGAEQEHDEAHQIITILPVCEVANEEEAAQKQNHHDAERR